MNEGAYCKDDMHNGFHAAHGAHAANVTHAAPTAAQRKPAICHLTKPHGQQGVHGNYGNPHGQHEAARWDARHEHGESSHAKIRPSQLACRGFTICNICLPRPMFICPALPYSGKSLASYQLPTHLSLFLFIEPPCRPAAAAYICLPCPVKSLMWYQLPTHSPCLSFAPSCRPAAT